MTPPVMSAEEAIADILANEECLTVSEAPNFIEEIAARGYKLVPIVASGEQAPKQEE